MMGWVNEVSSLTAALPGKSQSVSLRSTICFAGVVVTGAGVAGGAAGVGTASGIAGGFGATPPNTFSSGCGEGWTGGGVGAAGVGTCAAGWGNNGDGVKMEAFGLSVVCTGGGAAAPKRLKEEDEPIAGALRNG